MLQAASTIGASSQFAGAQDEKIYPFELANGTKTVLGGHESWITSLALTPDAMTLVSAACDDTLRWWKVAAEKPKTTRVMNYGGVRALALSPDGQWLVAAGLTKASNPLGNVQEPLAVRLAWKDGSVAKSHLAKGLANHTIWGACFHPDGTLIACIRGSSGHLLFWGPDTEKRIHKFDLPVQARGLDFLAATQQIATVHHDGHLRVTVLAPAA